MSSAVSYPIHTGPWQVSQSDNQYLVPILSPVTHVCMYVCVGTCEHAGGWVDGSRKEGTHECNVHTYV